MKKSVPVLLILGILAMLILAGCAGPSGYAGTVDTAAVALPQTVFAAESPSGENGASDGNGSPAFRHTAARSDPKEPSDRSPAETAYARLLTASSVLREPADQDLYIYRNLYRLSERAKTAGTDPEEFCRLIYGLSPDEYRAFLILNLRELLIVTKYCETNGVFYTDRDRERLLDGGEPLFPADEYDLQLTFYREQAMRMLDEQASLPANSPAGERS